MKLEIKDGDGRIIQTVDLADGEYTLSVSGDVKVTAEKTTPWSFFHPFIQTTLLAVFCLGLFLSEQYFSTAHLDREMIAVLKSGLELLSFVAAAVIGLSLVSRALTHQFQVWRCSNLVLLSFLGHFLWNENLLGFRWLLPRIFWINEIYDLFFLLWMSLTLWYAMKILFVHLHRPWRKAITLGFVIFWIFYNMLNFLPFRREYIFYHIQTPPPRPTLFESSPITVEEFLSRVKEN